MTNHVKQAAERIHEGLYDLSRWTKEEAVACIVDIIQKHNATATADLQKENDQLRAELAEARGELKIAEAVHDAMTDVGVYGKAVIGPNGYDKRTEFMEGWNACATEALRVAVASRESARAAIAAARKGEG